MERRVFLVSAASLVLLSGCNFFNQFVRSGDEPATQQEQSAAPGGQSPEERRIKQQYGEKGGEYRNFQSGDLRSGKEVILFFHASWSPKSQRLDEALKDWYDANYIPLSVYKLNYDEAIGMKNRFNVDKPNTFVRLDTNGEVVRKREDASEAQVLNMLRP